MSKSAQPAESSFELHNSPVESRQLPMWAPEALKCPHSELMVNLGLG